MPKQALVMIPGLGSDAAVWRRTAAALGEEVDGVIGDTLSDDTLPGMARRILEQAPQSFALAGVSMGGMVALEIMRIAPGRVTRLALVDTNARSDTLTRKAYRHFANFVVNRTGNLRRQAQRSVGSLVHPATSQEVRAELIEMGVRVGAKAYIRQNRAVSARGDARNILPNIAAPTCVIVGRDDRLTPVELSAEMHRLIPGSTLHVIPDCGHLPPLEKPEELAALLRELLDRR